MNHAVLLITCPNCHDDWLVLDTGQSPPDCPWCGRVPWRVSTTWTLAAASWWPILDGHMLALESAGDFLARLRYFSVHEHPAGPIGAKLVTPGMQLVQERAPNGDYAWRFARTAGSEN